MLSRRHFLTATAATSAAASLPVWPTHAATSRLLSATRRSIEVKGRAASVFGLTGPGGASGLVLDPGENFDVRLSNDCGAPTIIHWHGQTPPPSQDGVEDTGLATLIAPGASQSYSFRARPGTHWMHSHAGLQEQELLAAPLIVRTAEDLTRDAQEVVVLLHDFSFRPADELLAELTGGGGAHGGGANGGGGGGSGGHMMGGHMMGGGMRGMSHANDVEYDAYLANDRTLDDPQVVRAERGGRVHLRLINGASGTGFWIDLGTLSGQLIAVDGNPVQPVDVRSFPLAQAQRADIIVKLPVGDGTFPILAQREGDIQRTGIVIATGGAPIRKLAGTGSRAAAALDLSLESRLRAASPPDLSGKATRIPLLLSGGMGNYDWTINGATWENRSPLRPANGEVFLIDLSNHSPMPHPMHLHGHHFQVVAIGGRAFSGAVRDTVLVPPMGRVRIAARADNPGKWLLHCHNLFHMAAGMMTELVYS